MPGAAATVVVAVEVRMEGVAAASMAEGAVSMAVEAAGSMVAEGASTGAGSVAAGIAVEAFEAVTLRLRPAMALRIPSLHGLAGTLTPDQTAATQVPVSVPAATRPLIPAPLTGSGIRLAA